MSEPKKPVDSIAENLRDEHGAAKAAADFFVSACQTGDVPAFFEAVSQINETVGGWLPAMRKVAREVHTVSPEIRSTFLNVWIESKMLPLRVGNHRALCDAARVLLPN